jgi:hypothetical protein
MVDRLVAAELLADLKRPAFVARTLGDVGQGRSSFAYQPDGKMRVTSGPRDGEKVVSKDQVLKVWHANADARLHVARKTKAPDDWDPPSEPYDPYVRAA